MYSRKNCAIPSVWCGKKTKVYPFNKNDNIYIRDGSGYECLQKGIGVAKFSNTPPQSLQSIRYIGKIHEANFQEEGIETIADLNSFLSDKSKNFADKFLQNVLTKKNGTLDKKAFNSVCMFLEDSGRPKNQIPVCQKITLK